MLTHTEARSPLPVGRVFQAVAFNQAPVQAASEFLCKPLFPGTPQAVGWLFLFERMMTTLAAPTTEKLQAGVCLLLVERLSEGPYASTSRVAPFPLRPKAEHVGNVLIDVYEHLDASGTRYEARIETDFKTRLDDNLAFSASVDFFRHVLHSMNWPSIVTFSDAFVVTLRDRSAGLSVDQSLRRQFPNGWQWPMQSGMSPRPETIALAKALSSGNK